MAPEERCAGAGVICYSLDADNEIVLLLGKEREVAGWKQGSQRWGAFSGRAEEGETPLSCAAREFVEETCAAVPLDSTLVPTSAEGVAETLRTAPIFRRACLRTTPQPVELVHTSFLCRINYRDAYSRRFYAIRSQLLEIEAALRDYNQLRKNLEYVPKLVLPGFVLAPNLVVVDFMVDPARGCIVVEYKDSEDDRSHDLTFAASQASCREALDMWHAWKALENWVVVREKDAIFGHPAVAVTRHCGRITNVEVRRSYFEKTEIAWWRLSDLETLSMGGDRWRVESFRRYFLDNIRDIGEQIRDLVGLPGPPALATPEN